MKTKIFTLIYFLGISVSLMAQEVVSDYYTSGNEPYSIINISRSYTWQEWNTGSANMNFMVYINDKPVCELPSQSRVSIKLFTEGKTAFTIKYIPTKKYKEKIIDKCFHIGPVLEMDVFPGKTYFLNIDMKDQSKMKVNVTSQLVSIQDSEVMFKDEKRFKKHNEVHGYKAPADH